MGDVLCSYFYVVMICVLMVLIAQIIIETDKNLKHHKKCSTEHKQILPPDYIPGQTYKQTHLELVRKREMFQYDRHRINLE